jgi:hypothetical protein
MLTFLFVIYLLCLGVRGHPQAYVFSIVFFFLITFHFCDRERPSVTNLINQIKEEAIAWVREGAKGLRDVVPMTWDVH